MTDKDERRRQEDAILDALASGHRPLAIKLYSDLYGVSVSEARESVDGLDGPIWPKPTAPKPTAPKPTFVDPKHIEWFGGRAAALALRSVVLGDPIAEKALHCLVDDLARGQVSQSHFRVDWRTEIPWAPIQALEGAVKREQRAEVRKAATHALGQVYAADALDQISRAHGLQIDDPQAIDSLCAVLQDPTSRNEWRRASAARALGKIGDPRSVEALICALRREEWCVVRVAAAIALGEIGDPRAIDSLLAATRPSWPDPGYDEDLRFTARAILEGEDNLLSLVYRLTKGSSAERGAAAAKLGTGMYGEALPNLIAAYNFERDRAVRLWIICGLQTMTGKGDWRDYGDSCVCGRHKETYTAPTRMWRGGD